MTKVERSVIASQVKAVMLIEKIRYEKLTSRQIEEVSLQCD